MTVLEMGELRRILVFYSHLTQVRMPARGSHLKRKERKGGNVSLETAAVKKT